MGFKIGSREIGIDKKPFIIAEMSGNHNQSLEKALEIVELAAKSGVDALKIQTFTADTITLNVKHGEFFIDNPNNLWKGQTLYELYDKAHTPWEWHEAIFDKCKEFGIIGFSTPFDDTAVDFLESLNVPCYKIASFELTNIPLIKKVAATGKPMIISTGMSTISEIAETVDIATQYGCKDIVLLKCTSSYPASPKDTNIFTIEHMKKTFGCEVGISDHTLGIGVSIASIPLGATIIEKHFTSNRKDGGVDAVFSMEPYEFKMLVEESERAWQSLGKVKYGFTESEKESLKYRQSIYLSEDVIAGEIITKNNIRVVRPGLGLEPKFFEVVLGMKISKNLKKGTPLNWDMVK